MKISAIGLAGKRATLKVFILAVYFLSVSCLFAFASRNVPCVAQITAKVLSAKQYQKQITVSPEKTEVADFLDLEIEVTSVDSLPACEYKPGQRIKLVVVRDDINTYNRVKKNALIKPGTILKASIDHIADE